MEIVIAAHLNLKVVILQMRWSSLTVIRESLNKTWWYGRVNTFTAFKCWCLCNAYPGSGTEVGLVNSALGYVHSILYNEDNMRFPVVVIVKFDKYTGPSVFTETVNCAPIPPSSSFFENYGPVYERTQYPLKLAWAITIHKSQGLTLDQAWINLGPSEKSLGMSLRCDVSCTSSKWHFDRAHVTGKIELNRKISRLDKLKRPGFWIFH